jgi:pimeloyl-ACP methyl ester carboxylesterase
MPVVFVHGVPDTARLWDAVASRLVRDDVIALSLPGFACPTPPGFAPTKDAYVEWLLAELESLPRPIDLVGHDWGSMLVVRAVSLRPDLVRTWAGGAAPVDRAYEWHPTAQMWQTPGVGEALMEQVTPDAMREGLVAAGVPEAYAAAAACRVDAGMKDCILKLYRSAVQVGSEWEDDLRRITAPGLVLWGADDPYATPDFGARLAEHTGARFVSYAGCSHWWPLQRPHEVAAELERLWAAHGDVGEGS